MVKVYMNTKVLLIAALVYNKFYFTDLKQGNKLLSCDDSIDKLMPLLSENKFESGAHIDYYDL